MICGHGFPDEKEEKQERQKNVGEKKEWFMISRLYAVTHLLRTRNGPRDFAIRHYFLTNGSWMRARW